MAGGLGPVFSGLVGGLIATALMAWWARKLPRHYSGLSRETFVRRHRTAVWTGNAVFFLGLLFGIGMYHYGGFERTDPRPLLVGFGGGCTGALLALPVVSWLTGRKAGEAYLAWSWGQNTPLWATYGIAGIGVAAFVAGIVLLLR